MPAIRYPLAYTVKIQRFRGNRMTLTAQEKETTPKRRTGVRAASSVRPNVYFNRHPWFKKKGCKEGFDISSHPVGSKTLVQELRARSEASSRESLLAPRQEGAEFSNFC